MKLCRIVYAFVLSIIVFGCSTSIKKAYIPTTANPAEEISKLENSVREGYNSQWDVLASKDFERGQSYLKEAKEDLAKNKRQVVILDDIAYSKAYLQRAEETASNRRLKVLGIMDSRNKAFAAGAKQFAPTQAEIAKVDARLRGREDKLDKLSAEDIAEFNQAYSDIELKAIQNKELGQAKARIQAARDANAVRYSPSALKKAEVDYATAENLINKNRNDRDSYFMQVAQANRSAFLLTAILAETNRGARDEAVSTKVVMQSEQIKSLSNQLDSVTDEKMQLNATIMDQNEKLDQTVQSQNEKLNQANAEIGLQKTLAKAQSDFSEDEAEVFQQDDKIIIRLKKVQFASGKSELPTAAMPVLAKVKSVATDLGPKKILVEGHTDSVGSEIMNKNLSQNRAETIAQYLETTGIPQDKVETEGVGFSKPLATNKTKEGRAQNRRVDVIITPDPAAIERK